MNLADSRCWDIYILECSTTHCNLTVKCQGATSFAKKVSRSNILLYQMLFSLKKGMISHLADHEILSLQRHGDDPTKYEHIVRS
jgi:hypothetical protein